MKRDTGSKLMNGLKRLWSKSSFQIIAIRLERRNRSDALSISYTTKVSSTKQFGGELQIINFGPDEILECPI